MNKFQLADSIVAKTSLPKKDVELVMKTMLEVITDSLMKNEEVTLTGFGTSEILDTTVVDSFWSAYGATTV